MLNLRSFLFKVAMDGEGLTIKEMKFHRMREAVENATTPGRENK